MQTPLFEDFTKEEIDHIADCGRPRTFSKKIRVFSQGDDGNSVYFINQGRVKVFTRFDNGRDSIIRFQGPGEYFGEIALIDNLPRSATVETITDCDFKMVSRADFERCIKENPMLATKLIPLLTQRLRYLTEELTRCKMCQVYIRLREKMYELSVQQEDGTYLIDQRIIHEDLASMIGATRERVTYIINELRFGDWIDENDKRYVIKRKLPHAL